MMRLFRLIKSLLDLYRVKKYPIDYARSLGVTVGDDCRFISIRSGMGTFGSEPYLINIGDHVTIAGNVQFVNHDGGVWVFRDKEPDIDVFGPIVIGDNVFIGYGAIIMPSVTIGSNCVIGAGAVVTHDIPNNSVAVGCPAKVITTVEDYYQSIESRKDNVRSMERSKKRAYLERKFGCE